MASAPRFTRAQDTAASPAWYQSIAVKGLVMSNINYNLDDPSSRTNGLRSYDIDNQSFEIALVDFSVRRNASIGKAGFRADIDLGPHIPEINHAVGLEMGKIDLRQAYLSYIATVGNGLTIDVGKFVTPVGYEVIEGADAVSDNGSHSFLFGLAEPFTHTGVRLTYPVSDQFSVLLMGINGWDNVVDDNETPSVGAQLTWKPGSTSVALASIVGPEKRSDDLTRTLLDLAASSDITSYLTLSLAADYGREETFATASNPTAAPVVWKGIAGYSKITLVKQFAIALRAEVFDDLGGARTGVSQTLHEYTVTPIWSVTEGLTVKADLRYDLSSVPDSQNGARQHLTTAGLFFLYAF